MTNSQLKPGDVVELKSGGPKMTVESVVGETVVCIWFASELSELQKHSFLVTTLKTFEAKTRKATR